MMYRTKNANMTSSGRLELGYQKEKNIYIHLSNNTKALAVAIFFHVQTLPNIFLYHGYLFVLCKT